MSENVLVLGLGKSGVAAANYLMDLGANITIYAGKSSDAARETAQPFIDAGIDVVFDTEEVQGSYDLCIASPGIPQTGAFYKNAEAASTELISEPEFAWRQSPADWVSVTGTNGKTTTTSLITHLLFRCGKRASSCGNIGTTTCEAVKNRQNREILVAEMSSYQLASTKQFKPRSAVLLNITPDHISWHGSFEEYAKAKLKQFANMRRGSTAVLCAEVPNCNEIAAELRTRGVRVIIVGEERGSGCVYERDGVLYSKLSSSELPICRVSDLRIKGTHNVTNALAAAAVALDLGCKLEGVTESLKTFEALEHRIEPCGTVEGVEYYNDSKATNVDAVLVALTAFPEKKIVLLLGGRDKGTDLSELVEACKPVVRCIVAYGEAGQRFFDAFEQSGIERYLEVGMEQAFNHATQIAGADDVVLLSPACASFDEFNSFEHRGQVFKQMVKDLKNS